jgi:hypothetical protein
LNEPNKFIIMSDLNITGRMKVISFQKEFLKSYPHLYPSLRYPNDKVVEDDSTIANAKNVSLGGKYVPAGEADLSMRGNLTVGGFEKRFEDAFSVKCQIHFKKNGKWVKTGPKYDGLTLAAASKMCEEEGCEVIQL